MCFKRPGSGKRVNVLQNPRVKCLYLIKNLVGEGNNYLCLHPLEHSVGQKHYQALGLLLGQRYVNR